MNSNNAGLEDSAEPPKRRRGWLRKVIIALVIIGIAGAISAELFARYYLGLGEPPLSMADPQTVWRFQPNQTCHRFGHLIHYNAFSMRSDDCSAKKQDPAELRVMVVGDSITNGGAPSDQSETYTAILQERLRRDLHRPVLVMNCSAGGWGPPSELGYVKEFGFFDADVFVLELASHDFADVPDRSPRVDVDPNYPGHKPVLALQEAITRYVLPRLFHKAPVTDAAPIPKDPPANVTSAVDVCSADEREILQMAKHASKHVLLLQYLEQREMQGDPMPGYAVNRAVATAEGVPVVDAGPAFIAAVKSGAQPYRDSIHANPVGNGLIAESLVPRIEDALKDAVTSEANTASAAATRPTAR